VGAVDEGITVPAIQRIRHLLQACVADRAIRGEGHEQFLVTTAVLYLESRVVSLRTEPLSYQAIETTTYRQLSHEPVIECAERRRRPLKLQYNPGPIVPNETGQRQGCGEPIDERTKTDPLHHP
jgi:hypothetical protein